MPKGPVVPSNKKSGRPAQRPSLAMQLGIVLGSGTLVAITIGTYLVVTHVAASRPPMPDLASASMPADHSGYIVVKATSGTGCRRMKFDNATGSITDAGPAACEEEGAGAAAKSANEVSSAAMNRFGQISSGFKH